MSQSQNGFLQKSGYNPYVPNCFMVSNHLIFHDLASGLINPFELSLLLIVMALTKGFNKEHDDISLSQFEALSGMSRPTVIKYLSSLLEKGYLRRKENSIGNMQKEPTYSLGPKFDQQTEMSFEAAEAGIENLVTEDQVMYSPKFITLFNLHPFRVGKEQAAQAWNATVVTERDIERVYNALQNYKTYLMRNKGIKPEPANTWFASWEQWEDAKSVRGIAKAKPADIAELKKAAEKYIKKNHPNVSFTNGYEAQVISVFSTLLSLHNYSKGKIVEAMRKASESEFWRKPFNSPMMLLRVDKNQVRYIDVFLDINLEDEKKRSKTTTHDDYTDEEFLKILGGDK